jgi:hypothetical protein
MKINRRTPLSLLGASLAVLCGSARAGDNKKANLKDGYLIPRWPSVQSINVVVVGEQTNPYYQVANMSYSRSVSIDKWM